jgi:hypothetical protein
MKLIYNGFDFSTVGELGITQAREFEGGEQTQRARVRLAVRVDLFQTSYDENRNLIDSFTAALQTPNALLQWINDAVNVPYVSQTAVLVSEDLPDDWGQYHQTVNLVFQYYEQTPAGASNNLPLSFCKEGSGTTFSFDVVNRWQHSAGTERFSSLRSQRRETKGKIHVEGQFFGDTTQSLAARRSALAGQAAAMVESLNSSEGMLTFGAPGEGTGPTVFSGMVRMEEFTADLDQLVNAVNYAFTCSYTLFPDESDYATAEWTAAERDEMTGSTVLTVAGKIQAQDEAAARVKLAAILAQVVQDYGYLGGQQLSMDTTPNGISANSDGDTFTELAFSASYRTWQTTNQPASLAGLSLGQVNRWSDKVDTTRFSPLRSQRERTGGMIEASGTWAAGVLPGQGTGSLASGGAVGNVTGVRKQLLAAQRALKAAVNAAQVALAYGDWMQTIRVVSFTAEINQAETGIDWSLTGSYTLFPNEASYAVAEYTCAERDNFTGELTLGISGRIQAQSEAAARVKLTAVLTAQLTARNYLTTGVIVSLEATPNAIEADADGATFTEMAFNATYRKWKATNQAGTFGTPPVSLGNITKWHDRVSVTRFNPLRPHRERSAGTIEAAGCWRADLTLPLAQRRTQLLEQQRAMKAAINVAQGPLTYADWTQTVRVTEFNAEVNQAETAIEWSLGATYTIFPNEADYTTTEWTVAVRDNYTGEVTLTVAGKVQATSQSLAYGKFEAVVAAVTTQWGYATGGQKLNQEVTAASISANADGDTFIELSFTTSWRKWKASNQAATFTATGNTVPRALGNVTVWRDHYSAQRFNEMRSQRRHATGGIVAGGTIAGDMALTVAGRRAAMLALQAALKTEVNNADGMLSYGSWSQVVRVVDFQAETNQAETGIEWSLTAEYSLFPNEGGYATAEYTVNFRQETEAGDEFMGFAGKIGAPTAALATAKLTALRTSVLAMYSWTGAFLTRREGGFQSVYANGDKTATITGEAADGTTFLELSFTEEYRRRIPGTLVSSTLTISNREDIPAQTLATTYSGTVTASGATVDAAHATALARAQALGANREAAIDPTAWLRSSQAGMEQRQLTLNTAAEFVRLTFSYEYQSKLSAGRAYLELTTAVQTDIFGVDTETCSGFIAARDQATALGLFNSQVVTLYTGRLIQSQQTSFAQSQNQTSDDRTDQVKNTLLASTTTLTPGSGASALFNTVHVRMDFNLNVWSPKAAGEVGLKYSIEVARDFLALEFRTTVQGSCWAGNRALADAAVAGLLTALLGGPNLGLATGAAPVGGGNVSGGMASVRSRRTEDREWNTAGAQGDNANDVMLKLDFEEDLVGALTGQAGVNEMKLSVRIVYSGTRWRVQNLPFNADGSGGVAIPQPTGVEAGSRTVTGSVTAGTFATAQAWAVAQRGLLTGDALGGNYPQPEQWDTDYQFVPRVDGIPTGTGANVQLYRVGFTFGEILPLYPAP